MRKALLFVVFLFAASATADWFDIPVTPNVSFTAADDATWTVTVTEYSGQILNADTLVLSVSVAGTVSGGSPFDIYVALPSGKSAPRAQRFPVYSDVPGGAYGTSEGSVITIRRADGGQFGGDVKVGFTQLFRINAASPPPCTVDCDL